MITQLSVFLENSQGRLARLTQVLGDAGIDLKAVSVADTTGFGILRVIVEEPERARQILREAGFHATLTQVLGVRVADIPGGLSKVLGILDRAQISVEYLYSFTKASPEEVLILIHVSDPSYAEQILAEQKIPTLNDGE